MPNRIAEFRGSYFFLSNYYPARVAYEGIVYPTSEHAYQAAKSEDEKMRRVVCKCPTPGAAKALGQSLLRRSDWQRKRLQIMEDIVRIKFQDEVLRASLLETGDAVLIEGNTWRDDFWGVYRGRGENHLGKILMRIRQEIRQEKEQLSR